MHSYYKLIPCTHNFDTGFDMTDPTESKAIPKPRKKPAKPAPGMVTDALAEVSAGKRKKGNVVPNKERKIGRPTRRIESLVKHLADGKTLQVAAFEAGLPIMPSEKPGDSNVARNITSRPYVQDMIAAERAQTALDHKITRKNVLDGLKEAVDMARMLSEPMVMIAGWREIGKMCGFYEAVKVKVDLTSGGATLTTKLMTMTDEDLLRLATGQALEDGSVIEGDYEEVPSK